MLPADGTKPGPVATTSSTLSSNTAFPKSEPGSASNSNLDSAEPPLNAKSAIRQLCPVFVLDPWFLAPDPSAPSPGSTRVGINRIRFLLDCLNDLDSQLKARGSRLILVKGDPTIVIPKLVNQCGAKTLCFEFDTEPYALARDGKIKASMQEAGVRVVTPVSHTIFDPAEIINKNGGKPPLTYQAFCKRIGQPSPPVGPAPDKLPALPPHLAHRVTAKAEADPGPGEGVEEAQMCDYIEVFEAVPTLSDLGYSDAEAFPKEDVTPFRGGETEALRRLDDCLLRTKWVKDFEKPKGDPSALAPPATTVLSPYLKFGCLSSRLMYARIQEVLAKQPGHTKPPVSLIGQLLWREFFYTAAYGTPHFDCMQGSSICRQIPWKVDSELLAVWRDARTGFPWIDAIMVQLRQWGWMHHLARHCVACFLTRGDLLVHWELGRDVFDRLLVDSDWAINNGNWLWLSASAFFSQYHRIYSPVTFGKKYDPTGKFIRHFLPVLKVVDHAEASKRCRDVMGAAYAANCIAADAFCASHFSTPLPLPFVNHAEASKRIVRAELTGPPHLLLESVAYSVGRQLLLTCPELVRVAVRFPAPIRPLKFPSGRREGDQMGDTEGKKERREEEGEGGEMQGQRDIETLLNKTEREEEDERGGKQGRGDATVVVVEGESSVEAPCARVEVDVCAWVNLAAAAQSDELQDSVDYGEIYTIARWHVENQQLPPLTPPALPALAHTIATTIRTSLPRVHRTWVRLAAPAPASLPGAVGYAAAEITL
ncbi:unnamed protein product [Closterium sp. Naga37s-1]|nr:unnamed protein product [Closterium sp. Naga37s-1]